MKMGLITLSRLFGELGETMGLLEIPGAIRM
jgi:hypothetical protein